MMIKRKRPKIVTNPCYGHALLLLLILPLSNTDAFAGISSSSSTTLTLHKQTMSLTVPSAPLQAQHDYLVHQGRSKDMILRSPTIAGMTLMKGWTSSSTENLKRSVQKLVQLNPILTGNVYLDDHSKLRIHSGTFSEFFKIVHPPPNLPNFATLSPSETCQVLQTQVMPKLDTCTLTSQQIQQKLPLFSVTLMILDETYAILTLHVSHAVGDGVTFFQIVKELSAIMSGTSTLSSIQWDVPAGPNHELYPNSFSARDISISYGVPFLLGLLKNFPSLLSRQTRIRLLSKSKIQSLKRKIREMTNSNNISSNDLITAALCQSDLSSDVFVFTENARGRDPSIPINAGGNFLWEIPVSRASCSEPSTLRRVITDQGDYATNELPMWPFLCGRVARITSLASIAESFQVNGVTAVCAIPLASFIAQIPLDVAVIFRYDKAHWGILHNFVQFRPTGLLGEMIDTGD
jgi:hypothetical protein